MRAALSAAEHLSLEKQEQLARSLEEMIDELTWEATLSSPEGQAFSALLGEEGRQALATGDYEEIKDNWGE